MTNIDNYDYGAIWRTTAGPLLIGALICALFGTGGGLELAAAAIAAYVMLKIVGAMARADRGAS